MIKGLIQLSFTLFFFSFQNRITAQCSPDPGLTYAAGWGVIPDDGTVLPVQYVNEPYDYTLYFRAPTTAQQVVDAGYFSSCWPACSQEVDQIKIMSISGMPPGLSETCNTPNCTWYTAQDGCAQVTGTPTSVGYYTIEILLEGQVTIGFFTESRDYTMTFYQPIEVAPCALMATTSGTNESVINAYDGFASVAPFNGAAPFSYQWSNGSTQSQIIGLTANTYSVTVTDSDGCTATSQVTIETDDTTVDPCIGYNVSVNTTNESYTGSMDGSVQAIITNGTTPYSFSWTNNITVNPNSNLSQGPYSVTVTDGNGCVDAAGTIVLLDSIVVPIDTTTSTDTTIIDTSITDTTIIDTIITDTSIIVNPCLGFNMSFIDVHNESAFNTNDGSASIDIQNGTEPFNITWSNGNNSSVNTNLSAGNYWVYVQDSNGCSLADTVSLVIDDSSAFFCNLYLNFIKEDESSQNANDGSVSVSALNGTGPYSYSWSSGQNVPTLSNLSPGIYSVTATDNEGCELSDSIRIFPFGDMTCNLNVSILANPESSPGASDGAASALANGGTPPYEFSWSNGEQSSTIYNLSTSNYTVTITDANLCFVTGLTTVSVGPISVSELDNEENGLFSFYPNPTSGLLNISIASSFNQANTRLSIYNSTGKLVQQISVNDSKKDFEISLDKDLYPSGMYLLQLMNSEQQISKKLLIK